MRATNINGDPSTHIEYSTYGSPSNPAILLIMGLGTQMLGFRDPFCTLLSTKGYYVIRIDNRDIGLSRHYDEFGPPPLVRRIVQNMVFGRFCKVATDYTLNDMAMDGFGLLDALNIPAAHIVGVSMGGMIAQTMAIENPSRVLSLNSIMSTTGARLLPDGDFKVRLLLIRKPASDSHEDRVQDAMDKLTAIAAPAESHADLRDFVDTVVKRAWHPVGAARQLNAIMAQDDRTEALRGLRMPCLVVHGRGDKLVPLSHGEATAAAIGGDVRLEIVEGMGHTVVAQFNEQIVGAIVDNAKRAGQERATDVADVNVSVKQ
jgi:pimeloyl-ACP methyl ester carboxylesterase